MLGHLWCNLTLTEARNESARLLFSNPVHNAIVAAELSITVNVAMLLNELTDVANRSLKYRSKSAKETPRRREKRTRRALAGTAGPN